MWNVQFLGFCLLRDLIDEVCVPLLNNVHNEGSAHCHALLHCIANVLHARGIANIALCLHPVAIDPYSIEMQ